jgi:hypothetical protein
MYAREMDEDETAEWLDELLATVADEAAVV